MSARPWCAAAIVMVSAVLRPAVASAQVPDSGVEEITTDSMAEIPYAAPLPPEARAHLAHLLTAFPQTPSGVGLVPAGMTDARIALQHVQLAATDSTSLSSMTRHMAHVIHAIDPTLVGGGPGTGFGVKRAAEAVLQHLELAARSDPLPGAFLFHAPYAMAAARGAVARADEAVRLARSVQGASSAREAHRLVRRLERAVLAMGFGIDGDGDHRIGYAESEMGLARAEYHLRLVARLSG